MIKTKLKYDEGCLKTVFTSKRFLLEACMEDELGDGDFPTLLQVVRSKPNISQRQKLITAALKTHKPTQIMKFVGLHKYSAFWWAAVVRLSPSLGGTSREFDLLMVGWDNHHGTAATMPQIGDVGDCDVNFKTRVESKAENSYVMDMELAGIVLGAGTLELPKIEGLPDPMVAPELSVPIPKASSPGHVTIKKSASTEPEPIEVVEAKESTEEMPGWLKTLEDLEDKEDVMTSAAADGKATKKKRRTKAEVEEQKKTEIQKLMESRRKKSEW